MKEFQKYQLTYFVRYFGDALFYSFMSLYLISKNIIGPELGLVLAIVPVASIGGNLFFGLTSKTLKLNLLFMRILTVVEAVAIIIYGATDNYILIAALTFIVGFVNSPFYSLEDGIIALFCQKTNVKYSSIRIFGTAGYFFGVVLGGYFIEWFGYETIFIMAAVAYFAALLVWRFIKKPETLVSDTAKEEKGSFVEIFKNKQFIFYCLFYLFSIGVNNVGDSYFGVMLKSKGISDSAYGLVNGATIISETITLFVLSKYNFKASFKRLLLIVGIVIVLKNFIYCFQDNMSIEILAAVNILRGVGWGMILAIHVNVLLILLKPKNITKGILFVAIITALFRSALSYLAGEYYLIIGFSKLYIIIVVLQLLCFVFLALLKIDKKPNEEIKA